MDEEEEAEENREKEGGTKIRNYPERWQQATLDKNETFIL